MHNRAETPNPRPGLAKAPTGIQGLDEITGGGLPRGRPTLVCGAAGCGKTLLGMEFLVRGATQFGEPGVFMAFEETADDLAGNVLSLGFNVRSLVEQKMLAVDHVRVERSEIDETGEYDLEGLFVRLGFAVDAVGARRVVLDTVESLFSGLSNAAIIRAELRRLFRWLKERGLTAVITGERGEGLLTRHGLEEYVSDCVILLDHRVTEQITTRRLRIVKYRGSPHGTNEYPFLIDEDGISVLPITSIGLTHQVSDERVSSGVPRLDDMLGGGYYRGSSVLASGTAGTGKTSLAAHFADAACRRGERVLYFAFEESQGQLTRNMRSIGIDLARWIESGLMRFEASRPTHFGLEMHLAQMHKQVSEFRPHAVVIDPVSNFTSTGSTLEAQSMMVRLIDFLKSRQITGFFVSLTGGETAREQTEIGVSSIMDTWIMLRGIDIHGERNRALYVLKSRGTAHSNQLREFVLTPRGMELCDLYTGPDGVLTGSARLTQEAKGEEAARQRREEIEALQRAVERQRQELEAQLATLRLQHQAKEEELLRRITLEQRREERLYQDRRNMAQSRGADAASDRPPGTAP